MPNTSPKQDTSAYPLFVCCVTEHRKKGVTHLPMRGTVESARPHSNEPANVCVCALLFICLLASSVAFLVAVFRRTFNFLFFFFLTHRGVLHSSSFLCLRQRVTVRRAKDAEDVFHRWKTQHRLPLFYELAAFFFSFMVLCTFFFLCVRVCVYVCVSSCVSGMHVYHFFQLSRLSFFQRRSLYM